MRLTLACLTMLTALAFAAGTATAETPLTVASYVDLSIARLELAEESWQQGRPPSAEQEAALWQGSDTTVHEYLAFPGRNAGEVDAYLATRPDTRARIDQLSTHVADLIERAE